MSGPDGPDEEPEREQPRRYFVTDDFVAQSIEVKFPHEVLDVHQNPRALFTLYGRSIINESVNPVLARASRRVAELCGCGNLEAGEAPEISSVAWRDLYLRMVPQLTKFSADWYFLLIYSEWLNLRRSLEGAVPAERRGGLDWLVNHAIGLGAICREFELSEANKRDAVRGRQFVPRPTAPATEARKAQGQRHRDRVLRAARVALDNYPDRVRFSTGSINVTKLADMCARADSEIRREQAKLIIRKAMQNGDLK